MQREPSPDSYLWDMLNAAMLVQTFVTGRTFDDYLTDPMLRAAVEREVEIIGEAAGRIPREYRDEHPEIPWTGIIGQRHVLAHGYGEIEQNLL